MRPRRRGRVTPASAATRRRWGSGRAPITDPPGLPGQRAECPRDLDAVVAQQRATHRRLVLDVLGHADGQQGRERLALRGDPLAPELGERSAQRLVSAGVARPASLEALLGDDLERLIEGVDHVDRRRVVVGAGALAGVPVAQHQRQVEVPGARRLRARLQLRDRPLAGREGRQPGRAVQALLRPRERGVDQRVVECELVAAQRRRSRAGTARLARGRPRPARRAAGRRPSRSRRARRRARRDRPPRPRSSASVGMARPPPPRRAPSNTH